MDPNTIKLFSSKKMDNWGTPIDLYNKLNEEFKFNLDPCPINPTFDGLNINWIGNIFVNPPYSNISEWLKKAHTELKKGNAKTIVFLTFANTDTTWFWDYVINKAEIRFIRGRLRFLENGTNTKSSAMRPSILIIFKNTPKSESNLTPATQGFDKSLSHNREKAKEGVIC